MITSNFTHRELACVLADCVALILIKELECSFVALGFVVHEQKSSDRRLRSFFDTLQHNCYNVYQTDTLNALL